MLYTDDVCVVPRSHQGLANTSIIVQGCSAFSLTFHPKTRRKHCAYASNTTRAGSQNADRCRRTELQANGIVRVSQAHFNANPEVCVWHLKGQRHRKPGRDGRNHPKVARGVNGCREESTRRNSTTGQTRFSHSRVRMVKAEVVEALLCGCTMLTLRQDRYAELRAPHTTIFSCASSELGDESERTKPYYLSTTPSNKPAARASRPPSERGVSFGQVRSFACPIAAYPNE